MGVPFEVEKRWPELFEGLSDAQRRAAVNTLAADWHEGWEPDREDVENFTNLVRGTIDRDEYMRRGSELIEERRRSRGEGR